MRITEEFKQVGYFWLPSNPEKRIPGTLSISTEGYIELETIGLFDDGIQAFNEDLDLKRIVGHVEKDGLVTLEDCFYQERDYSFGGIAKSSIFVNKSYIGVEYEEDEEILLNTFRFSIEGIDEWVDVNGITVNNSLKDHTSEVRYSPPDEISYDLDNGMQLLITFSWVYPSRFHSEEAKITQKTYFKLVSTTERTPNDFISIAHKITDLLCFAIDQTVSINSVIATSYNLTEEVGKNNMEVPIRVYYRSTAHLSDIPKIHKYEMLFRYKDIRVSAEKMINNWLDAYDKANSAFSLYFWTQNGSERYMDRKFLALAQGLETYHRRLSDEKFMDESEFQELVKEIVFGCPEEYKEWLEKKLVYANEINLGKRIKRLIEPFKDIIGNSKQRRGMVRSIVDTRNYLTHYNESLKSKTASNQRMLILNRKMEALFQLHFLKIVGFTSEEIRDIFNRTHQLKNKFGK